MDLKSRNKSIRLSQNPSRTSNGCDSQNNSNPSNILREKNQELILRSRPTDQPADLLLISQQTKIYKTPARENNENSDPATIKYEIDRENENIRIFDHLEHRIVNEFFYLLIRQVDRNVQMTKKEVRFILTSRFSVRYLAVSNVV